MNSNTFPKENRELFNFIRMIKQQSGDYAKANQLFVQGKYKEAIKFYDKIIKNDANDVETRCKKAMALQELGQYEEAIDCYDDIEKMKIPWAGAFYQKQKEADINYNKGTAFCALKQYKKAIECLNITLKFNNKDIDALMAKSSALKGLDMYEEAIECLDIALQINPRDKGAHYGKAEILEKQKEYEKALQCYEAILKISPEDRWANGKKIEILEELDFKNTGIKVKSNDDEVNTSLQNHRLKFAPFTYLANMFKSIFFTTSKKEEEAAIYSGKGSDMIDSLMFSEAIEYFDKSIKLNSKIPGTFYNKGNVLITLGRYEEAIKCYDDALKINSKHINSYCNKGVAFQNLGMYKEALKCYEQVIINDPNDSDAFQNIGCIYALLYRYSESVEYFNKAIKLNPENYDTYNNKATSLIQLNKFEEAIGCYDQCNALEPHNPSGYYQKGGLLHLLNRFEEAYLCFEEGEKLTYDGLYEEASSYQNQGLYEEAITIFDNIIEIDKENNNINEGVLINKALCAIYKNNDEIQLTEDQVVKKIFKTVRKKQPLENNVITQKETEILIEPINQVNDLAKEYFRKKKKEKYKDKDNKKSYQSNLTKKQIKEFIFPKDYTKNKYRIELKFESNNKVKDYDGYKIGSKAIGGYNYWGVIDVDLNKDHSTLSKFVDILKEAASSGIVYNCSKGIKYIKSGNKSLYEVKIYKSDTRLYSNSIAEKPLNKVIIFDRIGNHSDVKDFIGSNYLEKKAQVENIYEV